ncbi:hypothetical protein SAMN04487912_105209 [Arthrobacter sp. cf158]|nr:hypothetical protein SAMN04487912_105209 [Arthrobacter sp. cf158]
MVGGVGFVFGMVLIVLAVVRFLLLAGVVSAVVRFDVVLCPAPVFLPAVPVGVLLAAFRAGGVGGLLLVVSPSAVVASLRVYVAEVGVAWFLLWSPLVAGAVGDILEHVVLVVCGGVVFGVEYAVVLLGGRVFCLGQFHLGAVACVVSFLAVAVAAVCSVAWVRPVRLLVPGCLWVLPAFLAGDAGVGSCLVLSPSAPGGLFSSSGGLSVWASLYSVSFSALPAVSLFLGLPAVR